MDKQDAEIFNAGWHCSSSLASLQDMVNKMRSFSHNEFNKPEFTDPKQLLQRVREVRDPYDRETKAYDRIDFDPDVPRCLLKHQKEFASLLDRDPLGANFKDYEASDFQQGHRAIPGYIRTLSAARNTTLLRGSGRVAFTLPRRDGKQI